MVIDVNAYIAFCSHSGINSTTARLEFEGGDYEKLAKRIFDNIFEFKDVEFTQRLVDAFQAGNIADFLGEIKESGPTQFRAKAADLFTMGFHAATEICRAQVRALEMYRGLMEMSQS